MVDITVKITGQCVETQVRGELVSGMVGAPVTFAFDSQWDGLEVIAVFRANGTVRDVALDNSGRTTVPWEVLQWAHTKLEVGVEGRNKDGTVVIPTLWGVVGKISPGAKVSGNPAAQPTPTQYDRLLKEIRRVEDSVPGWAKEPEKPKYTAAEVNALSADTLQESVMFALDEAKQSGQFDGPKGDTGPAGAKGDAGEKGEPGKDGEDYVLTEADKTHIAEMAAGLVEVPGGGTSFKTFTLTLGGGATLKITDMGNDLVHINFVFNGERDPEEPMQYILPTDNAEFNDFMRGKGCVFATNPLVSLYGTNGRQGTYANFGFVCVFGGENTEIPNVFMVIIADTKVFTDEKMNSMVIDITVTVQG